MTEINTFSAAVDDAINRSGRPDRKADIVAFVRTSIRECQVLRFFRNDMVEDAVLVDSSPFIWTYPVNFRILRTVRYETLNLRGQHIYPEELLPGRMQQGKLNFYYGGVGYYTFAGAALNSTIALAYYTTSKKLAYYTQETRPATYSLETNTWTYLMASTPEEQEQARALVSNWLLTTYYDVIVEGVMAKVLKVVGDPRAGAAYALYKSYQKDLIANEPSDSLNK